MFIDDKSLSKVGFYVFNGKSYEIRFMAIGGAVRTFAIRDDQLLVWNMIGNVEVGHVNLTK